MTKKAGSGSLRYSRLYQEHVEVVETIAEARCDRRRRWAIEARESYKNQAKSFAILVSSPIFRDLATSCIWSNRDLLLDLSLRSYQDLFPTTVD